MEFISPEQLHSGPSRWVVTSLTPLTIIWKQKDLLIISFLSMINHQISYWHLIYFDDAAAEGSVQFCWTGTARKVELYSELAVFMAASSKLDTN